MKFANSVAEMLVASNSSQQFLKITNLTVSYHCGVQTFQSFYSLGVQQQT